MAITVWERRSVEQMSKEYDFKLWVIEKEKDENRDISSTYIREELDQGNVEKAWELLGEPYAIHGAVVHGKNMGGRILGFPHCKSGSACK